MNHNFKIIDLYPLGQGSYSGYGPFPIAQLVSDETLGLLTSDYNQLLDNISALQSVLEDPTTSQSDIDAINSLIAQDSAQAAAINAWLNMTPDQQSGTDIGNYMTQQTNQNINDITPTMPPGTVVPPPTQVAGFTLPAFLTNSYLGIPGWGWGIGILAAVYFAQNSTGR